MLQRCADRPIGIVRHREQSFRACVLADMEQRPSKESGRHRVPWSKLVRAFDRNDRLGEASCRDQ